MALPIDVLHFRIAALARMAGIPREPRLASWHTARVNNLAVRWSWADGVRKGVVLVSFNTIPLTAFRPGLVAPNHADGRVDDAAEHDDDVDEEQGS